MTDTREVHLARRPQGWPTAADFRMVEADLPSPEPGQLLVRNTIMSVDPYMRGRMNDARSYVPSFEVGAPLDGAAVGEVLESTVDGFEPGDTVLHGKGWREQAVVPAKSARKLDPSLAPASAFLGVLGMPGLTAYAGLISIAEFRTGDTVFVSGAAGAVGSVVGQIARNLGATKVIGSAGTPEKVAYLTEELGFHAAFDYHDGRLRDQLRTHAPHGIDVYFDNVGGEHLEAAISQMNEFGRIAMCGAISQYNAEKPEPGPRNLGLAVTRRLRLQGFIVTDHTHIRQEYLSQASGWLGNGALKYRETYVDGLDHAVDAFLGVLKGDNIGKMLVRLG